MIITFEINVGYFYKFITDATTIPAKDIWSLIRDAAKEYNCRVIKKSFKHYFQCTEADFIIFKLTHPDAIKYTPGKFSVSFTTTSAIPRQYIL